MKIRDILAQKRPVFSFEFFPPKTETGEAALYRAIDELRPLSPDFVSVTYGAGGSTRAKTIEWVDRIKNEHGVEAMAHLTCVGASRIEIGEIVDQIASRGIENILALRGDPPKGTARFETSPGGFSHGNELVAFIRERRADLSIGAAGYPEKHPEAESFEADVACLRRKIDAGADFIITQLFFDNDRYFDFVKLIDCDVPVIPGIMPITSKDQIDRFVSMCGATLPAVLRESITRAVDDAEASRIGIDYAIQQVADLLDRGAPGIHFYTLNKSSATRIILSEIRK